jgi:hypothetical protein
MFSELHDILCHIPGNPWTTLVAGLSAHDFSAHAHGSLLGEVSGIQSDLMLASLREDPYYADETILINRVKWEGNGWAFKVTMLSK